jgi:predicted transposase/invertase (TIGR01784 family)
MPKYLDPKNDLTFKKIFGEHPHLLKHFLNALMPLAEGQEILSLEYLSAELVPETPLRKNSIVDVRCTDNFGRHFIVEMQMHWTNSFMNRVVFNASKAYVKQIGRGKTYETLEPVFALSLVNETFEKDTDVYYHHYSLYHSELPEKKLNGFEFVFVELEKFKAKSIKDRKMQVLWLRFMSEVKEGIQNIPQELLDIPEINEAAHLLEESAYTEAEMQVYDSYWDSIRVEHARDYDATQKGKIEGKIEGKLEGKLEVAKVLKEKGFDFDVISSATGLTVEEIAEL